MENKTNIYVKHQSFNDFFSSIKADPQEQKQRILNQLMLKIYPGKEAIVESIKKDLSVGGVEGFKITQHIADEVSRLDDTDVGTYAIHRYRYDIYPAQKILDAYPPYLQIEPTSVCNYRCVFCYQTDVSFTTKANGFMGTMSLDLYKEIIDQSYGNIEFFSLASRGEPLLCKEIEEMLAYCQGKFLGFKINTNASMLNERLCHTILSGGVNTIVFSADAAKEPLYSQLRVKGNLQKVLDNIRLFQDIRRKHYSSSRIISRVSGVKFGPEQDMDSMIQLWGEMVDQVSFVKYNPWENIYEAKINDVQMPCSDLWRRMFIWFDGSVNPCDTDFKSTLTVGQMGKQNISDLWQSQNYQQLRKSHLDKNRSSVSPCQRCSVV
ncbi:MAG: SPASM domain-containing protein [Candidatus Omnitrophica bacterium]|nr:SPASM domain-containing protein [Candidatus Omnitrophota bacterium]